MSWIVMEPRLARRNKLPIIPTWCEWPEECIKKATVQVVVFQADTLKVDSVWYACDYHGGEGKGPHTCRLEDVGREVPATASQLCPFPDEDISP